jgi:DNA helicase-2/ATP-dependent DNA helicase PcrA
VAISCVYCGGLHDRADEVRACWQRSESGELPAPPPVEYEPEPVAPVDVADIRPLTRPTAPRAPVARLLAQPARWAGPDALGRSLVLLDEQPVPEPWQSAPRLTIDERVLLDPTAALHTLRQAHQQRTRLVIDLAVAFHRPPAGTLTGPLHELGARAELPLDELHHLVWSNSVVLDHDGARWPWAEQAIATGARATDGTGDVEVPGVGSCFVDGGPLRFSAPIDGIAVVPAVTVEHGSLAPFDTNESAAALAPDQLAAVTHPGGTARIVAPAGSGKTRVLTERVRHLVTNWHLPPSAITLVAYNRRAQLEMQQRLGDVPGVEVRTLNTLALAIINGVAPFAHRPQRWRTIGERDVRGILSDFVPSQRKRNVDPLSPWLEALSAVRLGLRSPDEVEDTYDGDVAGLAEVFPQYLDALHRQGAVDFDGQITEAVRLLLTDPAARAAAQRACRVLLVDEFQDLTPAHVLFIRLLAAPGWAVFGVGDDDQTIYGYNGASPDWLIDYAALFPGAGDHPLEVNYRCPADVVRAADFLLQRNTRRVAKTIRAARTEATGLHPTVVADPVATTVAAVQAALRQGAATSEVAVLARVNAVLVPVQVALHETGIPATSVAGSEFLNRASVRSSLAWLRLACSPERSLPGAALTEAIQRPSRSIAPRVASWAADQRSIRELHRLADRLTTEREQLAVTAFIADLEAVRSAAAGGATTADVLTIVDDQLGLAGTLATFDRNRRGMNASSQNDDLTALLHLARLHPDIESFPAWLADALATPSAAPADGEGVVLATVHRVKGQEWPHVVVHLADEGQFPHRLADDVAEERRLFHVAITRTSGAVTVVSTAGQPSPFLTELASPPTPAELQPARRIVSGTPPSPRPAGKQPAPAPALADADAALFESLRALRDRLRNGKPAYTVFDNATLTAIAATKPTSLQSLARIKGIGPAKLEQYGEAVLAVVAEHLDTA